MLGVAKHEAPIGAHHRHCSGAERVLLLIVRIEEQQQLPEIRNRADESVLFEIFEQPLRRAPIGGLHRAYKIGQRAIARIHRFPIDVDDFSNLPNDGWLADVREGVLGLDLARLPPSAIGLRTLCQGLLGHQIRRVLLKRGRGRCEVLQKLLHSFITERERSGEKRKRRELHILQRIAQRGELSQAAETSFGCGARRVNGVYVR